MKWTWSDFSNFAAATINTYASCRHVPGPCDESDDKRDNNRLGRRELGLETHMLDSEPYYVHFFFLLLFRVIQVVLMLILTAFMAITTTSKHLTTRGPPLPPPWQVKMWLPPQRVETRPSPPLGHATTINGINGAWDAELSGLYFFVCLQFFNFSIFFFSIY